MPPMDVEPNGTDVQMKDVSQESSVGATESAGKPLEENENDAIKAQLMADKHAMETNSPNMAVKAFTKRQEDLSSLPKSAPSVPKDVSNPYRAAVKDLFDTHLNGNSVPTHQQNRVLPSVEGSDRGSEIDSNRLTKDMLRLKSVLDEVSHKAAQNVLREKWRTFLFDPPDESHVAFVLRAGLKNSTPGILHRVIKDDNVFKPEFVDAAAQKPALRKRVLQTATAEELLLHMPAEALSAIVASTIATASVKVLVSWLAKGNRLGFEESDIQKGNSEIFSPNVFPQQQPYSQASLPPAAQLYSRPVGPDAQINQLFPNSQHNHTLPSSSTFQTPHQPQSQQSHGSDALLAEQNRQRAIINNPAAMVCPDCKHQFTTMPGFQHHINKKPCNRPIPAEGYRIMCGNCLQGFTTKQGHDYHFLKRVCLGDDDSIHLNAPPAPPGFMPAPTIPSNDGLPAAHPSPNPYGAPTFPPRSPWATQQNERPQMPSRTPSFTPANGPQTIYPQPSAGTATSATKVKKEKKSTAERVDFTNASTPPTTRKQAPRAPDDVRIDPSQLPPEKLEALNRELAEVDVRYDNGIADIPADWSEVEKEARRTALKNANSSRKSQIRKTFGVTLRMREKDKQFKAARESMMRSGAEDSSPSVSTNTSPAPQSAPPARPVFDAARNTHHSPLVAAPVSGFSPVNAATRIVPPPPRYSPYTNGPSTNSSSAHPPQSSGFTPRNSNNNGYSRLDMNVRQYHGPEPKTKPVDSKPASASTSGVNTPSSTSNPALKRRHEELEHEKRPASGQGGYTGSIPSLPSTVANGGDTHEKVKVHIAGAAVHDPSRPTSPSGHVARVIDLLDDDDDEPASVSAVVNLVNSASSRKAIAATESKSGDEGEPAEGADGA